MHLSNHYFFHTLHEKCSELQCTLHNFLPWLPILIHPLLTYSSNPNKKNRRRKHINKLKTDREVAYMNDVGYHTFLDQVTVTPLVGGVTVVAIVPLQ
jgi:hypothetical protein